MEKPPTIGGTLPISNGMAFFSYQKTRKIIAAILILAFLLPSFFLIPAKKTEASGVPVGDWFNSAFHSIGSVAEFLGQGKEFGLDTIAWMLSSMVLKQITADVVDWINGGFNGNPTFINNPEWFFLDLGDQIVGDFIFQNEDLRFLCDPLGMGIDIRGALSISHFGSFRYRSSCRLSQIFSNFQNASIFIRGNFRVGGWTGWHSLTQIPSNNIYGSYGIAFDEMLKKQANKKSGERKLLDFGNGFLSIKKCRDNQSGLQGPTQGGETLGEDCEIITPGSFIESQLTTAFGENMSKIGLADELNEIINALIGQLLQKTLQGGLFSLSARSSTQSNPYSSRLRTSDPAAPFRRLTSDERAGYQAISQTDQAESQEIFDQLFAQADTQALNRLGLGTAAPNPKASLQNAFTHQACTYSSQYGSDGAAGLAIDNSVSTFSAATYCFLPGGWENSNQRPSWWEVVLNNPETVDEIRIEARSTKHGLYSLDCATIAGGCVDPDPFFSGPFNPFFNGLFTGFDGGVVTSPLGKIIPPYMEIDVPTPGAAPTTVYYPITDGSGVFGFNEAQKAIVNARVVFTQPLTLNRIKIFGRETVRFASFGSLENDWGGGVNLREVTLYKHLTPIFDLKNFPTTVDPLLSLSFQPLNTNYMKVFYFPFWDVDPVPILAESSTDIASPNYNPHVPAGYSPADWQNYMEVWVRDSNGVYCQGELNIPAGGTGGSFYCERRADPIPTYSLNPGYSFSITFVAREPRADGEIFKSLPVVKQFVVPSLPNINPL